METHLGIPEVKAFDTDVLLLIVPDSVHTMCTPITLGTLHIGMVIKLATKKELENLSKQWKRSLIATKLAMKGKQLVNQEETQIVSQVDSIVKNFQRHNNFTPFGTIKVKGVVRIPNHYQCINVVIDDLPEDQCCKDVVVMQQIHILRPGSNKIPVVLQNLSCRVLKIKKRIKIAHVEASNVVPSLMTTQLYKNMPMKVAGKSLKGNLLKNLPGEKNSRLEKLFESLNHEGIDSWEEEQQQSATDLITEYQNLFAINFSELGKTSPVQHDIKLDDMTLFKEWY